MNDRQFLAAFLLSIGSVLGLSQQDSVKAVYRNGNEILILEPGGEPRAIASDATPKGNPLWSKDGSKIAFERAINASIALDEIVVVDPVSGAVRVAIAVCPAAAEIQCGVTRIDRIEWLDERRIAAQGSVNPSTAQTFVYDIQTRRMVADYTDDSGGAVFSPNGEHAATLNGMPHFAAESAHDPVLEIDHLRVFPIKPGHPVFLSKIAWSGDSLSVAIIERDAGSTCPSVLICRVGGNCNSTQIPARRIFAEGSYQVEWAAGKVRVTGDEPGGAHSNRETWVLAPGEAMATASMPLPDSMPSPLDTEEEFARKIAFLDGEAAGDLMRRVALIGGRETDIWCRGCGTEMLPRTAPRW